jgi:ferredoxin
VAKKVKIPIVGIGGIGNWTDAAEHIALGASTVQVCTAAMHYGFRIVEDMADGLSAYMDDHGYRSIEDFRGRAVANVLDWGDLDLNYKIVAKIHTDLCIGCQLCYVACEDGAHQLHRTRVSQEWKRQAQRKRNGGSRSADYRRRVRGVQFVRARLSGGWLYHHAASRQWPASDVVETEGSGPSGSRRAARLKTSVEGSQIARMWQTQLKLTPIVIQSQFN